MENAKGVDTPDVKKSADQQMLETKSPLLNKDLASLYRSSVMRAAYLAQDRPDLGHAVKNLARKMVSPTEASMSDLKRLVRYVRSMLTSHKCLESRRNQTSSGSKWIRITLVVL